MASPTTSEDGPGANIVEACSWDLTMGAATHMIGKIFLSMFKSRRGDFRFTLKCQSVIFA